MLGSLENAKQLVLAKATGVNPRDVGFDHAGMGAYRNAYIGPDGNIYKLDRNPEAEKSTTGYNYSEWVGLVECQDMIPFTTRGGVIVRLARSQMFQVGNWFVLCQEYVDRDSSYCWLDGQDFRDIMAWFGVSDMHGENYRVDENDNVVITDFGFNSSHGDHGQYVYCPNCNVDHYCEGNKNTETLADRLIKAWHAAR